MAGEDELRRILGDADYEDLSSKINKFDPRNITEEQLLKIKSKMYRFGFAIQGDDAIDLILSYVCVVKNDCEDCGMYLSNFLREIVGEVNFTLLGDSDE